VKHHPAPDVALKASVTNRFEALLIDSIVAGVLVISVGLILSMLNIDLSGFPTIPGPYLSALFIYKTGAEAFSGQTHGKASIGITVRRVERSHSGIRAALVRNLFFVVDFLPLYFIAGVLSIGVTDNDQRVGDLLASTVVVRTGS
jgi:uncharacterized RDD family membrane protein YckC